MKSPLLPIFILSFLCYFGAQAEEKAEPIYGKLLPKLKHLQSESVTTRSLSGEETGTKSLYSTHHLPRTGDYVIKLEASYMEHGESGKAIIWDFNHLKISGEENETDYFVSPTSSLTGIDNTVIQSYEISEDTLFIRRYENPFNLIYLEKPEEIMIFPMSYGDERINYFYGKGKYCDRLETDIAGITYSQADGYGNLVLPENDTIYNVLRVYTAKITWTDSRPVTMGFDIHTPREVPLTYEDVSERLERDSSYTFTETYRWYAEGSRYPVLETGSSQVVAGEKPVMTTAGTYVYHPYDQQLDFPADPANPVFPKKDIVTETVTIEEELIPNKNFNISTYPNPVLNELNIEIQLESPEKVEIYLYNLHGQLLKHKNLQAQAGIHRETVDMKGLEKGNYLLKIRAGENSESKIILKQ